MKFYDSKTGKPTNAASVDEMQQKLLAGEAAAKKSDSYNVLDESGKSFSISGTELKDALQSGYKLESPDQQAVREYVKANEGVKGALKVGAGQFLDEALGGIPELIYDKNADPLDKAKKEALKDAHDVANTVGGVAGFGASMFGPGPLSKLGSVATKAGVKAGSGIATKVGTNSVAKKILGNVAQKSIEMGVEGAVFAAPKAITEAALGDLDLAAESILWGGGLGAAFGGGASLVKDTAGLLTKTQAAKRVKDFFNTDEAALDLIGMTSREKINVKKNKDVMEGLGDYLRDKANLGLLDDAATLEEKVLSARSRAAATIDDVITKSSEAAPMVDPATVYQRAIDNIQYNFIAPKVNVPGQKANIKMAMEEIAELKLLMNKEQMPLQELNLKRKELDDLIFKNNKDPANTFRGEVATEIRKAMVDRVQEVVGEFGGEAALAKLKEANREYSIASTILKPLTRKANAKGESITSLKNMILGGTGFGIGGPVGAAIGIGVNAAIKQQPNAVVLAEKYMGRLAKELDGKIGAMFTIASNVGRKVATPMTYSAMRELVGDEGNDREKLARLEEKVSGYIANPSSLEGEIAKISNPMSEDGAPEVASLYSLQAVQAMKYIDEIMPKQKRYDNPIFGQKKPYQVSDADLNKFKQQLEIVHNPLKAVDALTSGSLTKPQVDVLERLYPRLLDSMRSRVIASIEKNPKKFTYSERLKFNRLLGVSTDYSLQPASIKSLQTTFNPENKKAIESLDKGMNPTYRPGRLELSGTPSPSEGLLKAR